MRVELDISFSPRFLLRRRLPENHHVLARNLLQRFTQLLFELRSCRFHPRYNRHDLVVCAHFKRVVSRSTLFRSSVPFYIRRVRHKLRHAHQVHLSFEVDRRRRIPKRVSIIPHLRESRKRPDETHRLIAWRRARMRKRARIARINFQIRHPDFIELAHDVRMPHHANAFKRSKSPRERNPALVRHVNAKRLLGIKCESVVREQHIVAVAFHHFFGKVVFVTHHGIQVHAVLEQPKRHIVTVLRVDNVVARSQALPQFREDFTEKIGVRLDYRQFHLGTRPQEFADNRHATSRMPKSPIKRRYKDFHFSASSQA